MEPVFPELTPLLGGDRGQANDRGAQFTKRAVWTGSEGRPAERSGELLRKGYYKNKASHACKGPGALSDLARAGVSSEPLSLGLRSEGEGVGGRSERRADSRELLEGAEQGLGALVSVSRSFLWLVWELGPGGKGGRGRGLEMMPERQTPPTPAITWGRVPWSRGDTVPGHCCSFHPVGARLPDVPEKIQSPSSCPG